MLCLKKKPEQSDAGMTPTVFSIMLVPSKTQ